MLRVIRARRLLQLPRIGTVEGMYLLQEYLKAGYLLLVSGVFCMRCKAELNAHNGIDLSQHAVAWHAF